MKIKTNKAETADGRKTTISVFIPETQRDVRTKKERKRKGKKRTIPAAKRFKDWRNRERLRAW